MLQSSRTSKTVDVRLCQGRELTELQPSLESFLQMRGHVPLSFEPGILSVLERGLRHVPYVVVAEDGGRVHGFVALAYLKSMIFGRFLVSLPYVNSAGVVAEDDSIAARLVDLSVQLADRLGVRYLELRHERAIEHPALKDKLTSKIHMRLELPRTVATLWDQLHSKVRNQVRKGQKNGLTVAWGGEELVPAFYQVFSENMRDLGTPVYGPQLFTSLLRQFAGRAEICVVRDQSRVLASALLLHGQGVTEVPSASSLRRYNYTNSNMLMYWQLLSRAIERGQNTFDFGRSSVGSPTYIFKKQWGAVAVPAVWQYYLRKGTVKDMRPDSERFRVAVKVWSKLPLLIANSVGPAIVRGIP